MSKQISQSDPAGADILDVHLRGFIEPLAKAGYAKKTQDSKERLIAPFIRWVHEAGIAARDVDEACVDAFLACPSRRRYNHRSALQQFVEHLQIVEVVPLCRVQPSPDEVLLQKYLAYLRDKKGLSSHSISVYSPFVRAFVVAQRLPDNAAAVNVAAVRSHLPDHARNRCVSFVRLLTAALRSFLRFCFLDGTIATDLSTAVPPVRRWQLAPFRRFSRPRRSSGSSRLRIARRRAAAAPLRSCSSWRASVYVRARSSLSISTTFAGKRVRSWCVERAASTTVCHCLPM